MKIKKIDIEGFGVHAGLARELPTGNIAVVYGGNERGKTTIAKFLNFVLYGAEALTGGAEGNTYDPVTKAGHGGAIEFESGGDAYRITRYYSGARSKKGGPEIRDAEGAPVDTARFESSLRHGVTHRSFSAVFSFDIDELAPVKGKNRDRLDEVFYDTMGGDAGGVSPKSALETLRDRLAAFYPTGSKKQMGSSPLGKTIERLESLESEINVGKSGADKYAQLIIVREEIARAKKEIADKIAALEAEIKECESWAATGKAYGEYLDAKTELDKNSAAADFPEGGLGTLERLEEALKNETGKLAEKRAELGKCRSAIEASVVDEKYIEHENEIIALYEQMSAYRAETAYLSEAEQRLRELDSRIESEMRTYLPDWTRNEIEDVKTGIEANDAVKTAASRIVAVKQKIDTLESEIAALLARIDELKAEIEQYINKIDAIDRVNKNLPPDEFKKLISEWIEYDHKIGGWREQLVLYEQQYENQKFEADNLQSEVVPTRNSLSPFLILAAVLATAGIFLLISNIVPGAPWLGKAIGGGLVAIALVIAFISAIKSKNIVATADTSGVQSQIQKVIDNIQLQISNTEGSIVRGTDFLNSVLRKLEIKYLDREAAGKLLDKLAQEQTIIDENAGLVKSKEREIERLSESTAAIESGSLATARSELADATSRFAATITRLNLRDGLSSEAAIEILGRTASLKEKFNDRRIGVAEIESKRKDVENYKERVFSIAARLNERAAEHIDAAALIDIINKKLTDNKSSLRERNQRIQDAARIEKECSELEAKTAGLKDEIAGLLEKGGAPGDPAAFRGNAAQYEKYEAAFNAFENKTAALLALKPSGTNEADFFTQLGELHPDGWAKLRAKIENLNAEKSAAAEANEAAIREEEANKNEIGALLGSDKLRALEQEYEAYQQLLAEQVRTWSVRSVAAAAMEKIAEEDERKRMPDIKRFASELFAAFTGGAFEGVYIDPAAKTVEGVRAGSEHVPVAKMSRSVRQELYLAIRLAQTLHVGAGPDGTAGKRETMPVIMDDVLVDIDDDRLPRVAAAIADRFKSVKTQIIYFTAHEHIRRAFESVCGPEAIITI